MSEQLGGQVPTIIIAIEQAKRELRDELNADIMAVWHESTSHKHGGRPTGLMFEIRVPFRQPIHSVTNSSTPFLYQSLRTLLSQLTGGKLAPGVIREHRRTNSSEKETDTPVGCQLVSVLSLLLSVGDREHGKRMALLRFAQAEVDWLSA